MVQKIIKAILDNSPWAPDKAILEQQREDVASQRRRDRALLSKRGKDLPFGAYPLPRAGDSSEDRIRNVILSKLMFWWLLAFFFLACAVFRFLLAAMSDTTLLLVITVSFLTATWQTTVWWPRIRKVRQGMHGERLVAEYLSNSFLDGIEGKVRIYHDIPHGTGNFDHVVFCQKGIYLVNTKTMAGLRDIDNVLVYRGDHVSFKNSGKPLMYDPVQQMRREVTSFKELLRACDAIYDGKKADYKEPTIRGVVLFPGWQVEDDGVTSPIWVMDPKELSGRICSGKPLLNDDEVIQYSASLSRWMRGTVNLD